MSVLKRIESPSDLKKLSPEEFPELCQEIRSLIISVLSSVGGHLASNLGGSGAHRRASLFARYSSR